MMFERDETFVSQIARFRLRWHCEDCVCFDPASERCAHGFPTAKHRAATDDDPNAPVAFCKEHEIG
jgi:hypothetical protein